MKSQRRDAFTLVELMIVIVILGILAALAVPQFVSSTKDAEEATLAADLAVLRNAINLYYHQHSSNYPGAKKESGDGTDTDGAANPAAFNNQMSQYTDKTGKTSADLDRANYPFGPYLATGLPDNPLNGLATVEVLADADAIAAGDIDGLTGWVFNKNTGEIRANTTGYLAY